MSLLDGIFPDIVKDLVDPAFLGTICTFRVQDTSEYDPLTGLESTTAQVSQSINCSPPLEYEKKHIDGTMILQGDLKLYVSQSRSQAHSGLTFIIAYFLLLIVTSIFTFGSDPNTEAIPDQSGCETYNFKSP